MRLTDLPSSMTDWSSLPAIAHPGKSGTALMRSRQFGDIQLRMVEYSPSYSAEEWCRKGHLALVVSGEILIEHEDGLLLTLPAGTSYHVGDGEGAAHRVRCEQGSTVFIVD
jgi:hypothetical protein